MNDLVFSIAMPIGSFHPFLADSLASLLAQKAKLNIAFLDASGDPRVKALADRFDDRLHYRRHGPDGGQSDAILEGWKHAPGDVLGWLNADDILYPDALEKALERFQREPELDVVYGHSAILDEHGRMTGYHWAVEPPGPRLLEAGIVSQPSCFFRRDAYERAGGLNADLHYTMDWDLWIRLYKSGAKFGFTDDVMSMVLWGDDTKTSSFNIERRRELRAIARRKESEDFSFLRHSKPSGPNSPQHPQERDHVVSRKGTQVHNGPWCGWRRGRPVHIGSGPIWQWHTMY